MSETHKFMNSYVEGFVYERIDEDGVGVTGWVSIKTPRIEKAAEWLWRLDSHSSSISLEKFETGYEISAWLNEGVYCTWDEKNPTLDNLSIRVSPQLKLTNGSGSDFDGVLSSFKYLGGI